MGSRNSKSNSGGKNIQESNIQTNYNQNLNSFDVSTQSLDNSIDNTSNYKGINYSATINGKEATNKVSISGVVDTSHIGEYKLNYEIRNGNFKTNQELIVNVVDKIPPKITTINNKDVFEICTDNDISNIKYSAQDNYDGDLTDKVEITHDLNKAIYKVSDNSGNISTKEITLKASSIPPTIELNGDQYL